MNRFRHTLLTAAFALAAMSLGAPEQASATAFCPLKQTSDGFVALRAGPSPTARLIARMKPEDEVLIGLREKGNWVEVTWWRGQNRHDKGYHHIAGKGWVNSKLIAEEC
jgi:hypothetical protein